jgi:hypothetical protein
MSRRCHFYTASRCPEHAKAGCDVAPSQSLAVARVDREAMQGCADAFDTRTRCLG